MSRHALDSLTWDSSPITASVDTRITEQNGGKSKRVDVVNQIFPKIDDSCNVSNKGLRREEQNKSSKICYFQWGPQDLLLVHLLHSHDFLTELTWQVFRDGYLTLLLLVQQLNLDLDDLAEIKGILKVSLLHTVSS